jgi:Spy/CpxP family protein refolding chaperone
MATAGPAVSNRWSRQRVWLAVLAASLALNLFFIAGAVWTRLQPPPDGSTIQHFQQIANELSLDDHQRDAFNHYVAVMRNRSENDAKQILPLVGAAWDAIAKPNADPAQVLKLFDEVVDRRRQSLHDGISQMLDFLALLSPEQRSKFASLMRERRVRRLHPGSGS